jgi:hypothetical protein
VKSPFFNTENGVFCLLFADERDVTLFITTRLVKNLLPLLQKTLSENQDFAKIFTFLVFLSLSLKLRLHLVIVQRIIWLIGLIATGTRKNLDAVLAGRGFLFTSA